MRNIIFIMRKISKVFMGEKKNPGRKTTGWVGSYQYQILQSNEGQIFAKKLLNLLSKRPLATSRGVIVESKKHSMVPKTQSPSWNGHFGSQKSCRYIRLCLPWLDVLT